MPESGIYNPEKHLGFLGLSRNPFPLAPDNTDFYISQHNDMVIEKLTQGIVSRKGFMLLTGEIGLGKTTLSRRIIQLLGENKIETALILQSFYQGETLLRSISKDFGIQIPENEDDFSGLMTGLNNFLLEKNQAGINCAIIIDDAQNLSIESLELIRMISSLEADREKLVQILLVGQPELMDKLNRYDLRQLKSRVTITQKPLALKKAETAKYIQFKLNMAGDSGKIILKKSALRQLQQLTGGNLRKINILMDKALYYTAMDDAFIIKSKYIKKADKELSFGVPEYKDSRLTPGLVFFLLFLIVTGIGAGITLYYYVSTPRNPLANKTLGEPITQNNKRLNTPQQPTDINAPPQAQLNSENPETAPQIKPAASAAVKDFLSVYALESYSNEFQQALGTKDFKDISNIIFQHSGYQLIILNSLPDIVREKFDLLSSREDAGQKKQYYLFWKPEVQIKNFYIGSRGQEIRTLQKILKQSNFYDHKINGIVGQKIINSVKDFQRQYNLPITGFPDPETIFLLVNRDEE